MTDTLWKIVELGTNGWYVIDPKVDQNLTKEQAERRLEHYIGEGYSPQRLKAKHQNDNRIDKQVMAVRKMSKDGSPIGAIQKKTRQGQGDNSKYSATSRNHKRKPYRGQG